MKTTFYCSGCKTERADGEFARNRAMKSGRANWCKHCIKKLWQTPQNQKRRMERREANWTHSIAIECRVRARKRNEQCTITGDDLIVPEFCPVLGIKLRPKQRKLADDTPSVDRIDPRLGYVKGNVAVISWLANRLKSDCADPAIFEAIAAYMRRNADANSRNEGQLRLPLTRAVQGFPRTQGTLGLPSSSSSCW